MIITQIFHTYRESFPLIKQLPHRGEILPAEPIDLNKLFKILILELSEFSNIPKYCYITRHTNDKIPVKHLEPFKKRYSAFVNAQGKNSTFGLPTVWLVVYSDADKSIESVRRELEQRNIKYFSGSPEQYASLASIPPDNLYTLSKEEAERFPRFLHQVTQIGVDLLRTSTVETRLRKLKSLEYMTGPDLESEIAQLKDYLKDNSSYYRESIRNSTDAETEFWANFRIVHGNRSWPHFLFNICGA